MNDSVGVSNESYTKQFVKTRKKLFRYCGVPLYHFSGIKFFSVAYVFLRKRSVAVRTNVPKVSVKNGMLHSLFEYILDIFNSKASAGCE